MTKLMVATGKDATPITSVEVINLDPLHPNLICDPLPNYPIALEAATGQLYRLTTPTICGGLGSVIHCECNQLVNGVWSPIASLNECKYSLSSFHVTINGSELMVVTGGYDGHQTVNTVETFDGNSWSRSTFASLPESVQGHCTVKISDTMFLSIGGSLGEATGVPAPANYTGHTYIFNVLNNSWTPGPPLNIPRVFHSCGVVNWRNPNTGILEKTVVVAGGRDRYFFKLDSVELLYLGDITSGWTNTTHLPLTTESGAMVEFQNSVIYAGGDGSQDGRHLYQLSDPNGNWTSMPMLLQEKRCFHFTFLVPDSIVNCH